MTKIRFDYTKAEKFISKDEVEAFAPFIEVAHNTLHNGTGRGKDFTGWVNLPENYDKEEFARIKKAAEKIKGNSQALIVIGIGGSYLGARMAVEMIHHNFFNLSKDARKDGVQIFFAGNNISSTYLADLIEVVKDIDFSVNIISKSGTTTEPAIAFRVFREMLIEKYGKEGAKERIFATTDKEKGALKNLADEEGYETFVVPDDVGGRYSVLTAVGLLPIAASGADIDAMMQGAYDAMKEYNNPKLEENDCYKYVAARNALYRKGKNIEIMVNYEPQVHYFAEWWKQLFGESEGKENKGIFPASVDFSSDLHSMGQYIQQGLRMMFETVLFFDNARKDIVIKEDADNVDGLNFLAGKTVSLVNEQAFNGTLLAHTDGDVPNLILRIEKMDEYCLGNLIYFFEKACGISGYILGVNPFDQPGVEAYKKNMFALLGKPGYEAQQAELLERLNG
ncbi:MAG: glucose-6-phosphate isomerase [Ruminococcaceae bacterium]|nr:glucose-6-phosphate isomerase [Oscillospiraceae bacterium]